MAHRHILETIDIIDVRYFVTIIVLLAAAIAGAPAQSTSKTEQEIITIEHRWARAIAQNDSVTLGRILTNDIVAISANGIYKTKQDLIAEVHPPPDVVVDGFTVSDVKTRVAGSTIVTTGAARLDLHAQGKQNTNRFLYTHVYVMRSGRWQIANLQMTRIQAR